MTTSFFIYGCLLPTKAGVTQLCCAIPTMALSCITSFALLSHPSINYHACEGLGMCFMVSSHCIKRDAHG